MRILCPVSCQLIALSPPGCSVADWECLRATTYVSVIPNFQFSFGETQLTDAEAQVEAQKRAFESRLADARARIIATFERAVNAQD